MVTRGNGMMGKTNLADLLTAKGKKTWVQLHVDSSAEAAAAVDAGITALSCEPDHTLNAIRKTAPTAFISAGMPHGAVATPDEAIRYGFAVLARGADAIYTSHSARFIEAMAREGIPVTGHVGLVPNLAQCKGFRAVGRTAEEAIRVLQKARDIENAGAACLEVEVVPVELAAHLTRTTAMITMGMGCGTACDTQYLFSCDVLGSNTGHYPRHARRYADFATQEAELQTQRIAPFRAFADDVAAANHPTCQHEVHWDDATQDRFAALVQRMG